MASTRPPAVSIVLMLLALGVFALAVAPAASQPPPDLFAHRICIEDLVKVRPIGPIPVGCEIVDCCPGCPNDAPIDWRVRVQGGDVGSVILDFDDLPPSVQRQLRIEGPGRWLDERRLEITAGEVLVRGFPRTMPGRSPVAMPRLVAGEMPRAAARRFELAVEQLVGAVPVNTFRARFHLVHCRWRPVGPDTISLKNNTNADNAVVLLDAQRDPVQACPVPGALLTGSDEVWRGSGDIPIDNALATLTCNSEVVVFSQNNAMQLVENVGVWTDGIGDRLNVTLAPKLTVPVTVWVVYGAFTNATGTGVGDFAAGHVQRAHDLYGSMNCGAAVAGTVSNATTLSPPPMLRWRCSEAASLRSRVGFTPGHLNAYYVAEVAREDTGGLVRGATCGLVLPSPTPEDRDTLLLSVLHMDGESLAHEMGHGLSLRDRKTDGVNPGDPNYLPPTNLMNGGGTFRNGVTEGQCFQVNVNPESFLNRSGIRMGPTRSCPDATASALCPPLNLDVDPNN